MDTPEQFRARLDFLEREYGFELTSFQSTSSHMLNINAIYTRSDCRVEVEREGSRVHTHIAVGSEPARPIDYFLERNGLDPLVHTQFNGDYDYFGSVTGLDIESQVISLRRILPSIISMPRSDASQGI